MSSVDSIIGEENYKRKLAEFRKLGDWEGELSCLSGLTNLSEDKGDYHAAISYSKQRLEIFGPRKRWVEAAYVSRRIATLYWRGLRDAKLAMHYMDEAVSYADMMSDDSLSRYMSGCREMLKRDIDKGRSSY